jgi:hypothetical protein
MAARTAQNSILRDARKSTLLRMTAKPLHGDDTALTLSSLYISIKTVKFVK